MTTLLGEQMFPPHLMPWPVCMVQEKHHAKLYGTRCTGPMTPGESQWKCSYCRKVYPVPPCFDTFTPKPTYLGKNWLGGTKEEAQKFAGLFKYDYDDEDDDADNDDDEFNGEDEDGDAMMGDSYEPVQPTTKPKKPKKKRAPRQKKKAPALAICSEPNIAQVTPLDTQSSVPPAAVTPQSLDPTSISTPARRRTRTCTTPGTAQAVATPKKATPKKPKKTPVRKTPANSRGSAQPGTERSLGCQTQIDFQQPFVPQSAPYARPSQPQPIDNFQAMLNAMNQAPQHMAHQHQVSPQHKGVPQLMPNTGPSRYPSLTPSPLGLRTPQHGLPFPQTPSPQSTSTLFHPGNPLHWISPGPAVNPPFLPSPQQMANSQFSMPPPQTINPQNMISPLPMGRWSHAPQNSQQAANAQAPANDQFLQEFGNMVNTDFVAHPQLDAETARFTPRT